MFYAIPCEHPEVKDGMVYCQPSFANADHMRNDFLFMLVDTKKVVAELSTHNTRLLEHADYKFCGSTVAGWMRNNSEDHPFDMGHWGYLPPRGLAMSSGQAALLSLVQQIDLPCFPIAIEKATGSQALDELRSKVGYEGKGLMHPAALARFRPGRLDR